MGSKKSTFISVGALLGAAFYLISFCTQAEEPKSVSYTNDIVPILVRSCQGCHHPGKLEAGLSLMSYEEFKKGGETDASFVPGKPERSYIMELIEGEEATMPKDGEKLKPEEIELIARWIREGAVDDSDKFPRKKQPTGPPIYTQPPVISALTYSPDGAMLAVSGHREVLLHKADGSEIVARLVGLAPRIESIAYSPDGKQIAVSGGAPALYGEIQLWDAEAHKLTNSWRFTHDTLYGASFSPDGSRLAFGCADKTARMIETASGKQLLRFDNHSDWVFDTTFTMDGKRLLTGSRDRAMKLIDASSGQFIDDINKLLAGVLCLDRHPIDDAVTYGGQDGTIRTYRMKDNQQRTAANNDVNLVREYPRQAGPVLAVQYSPGNSKYLAAGGAFDSVKVFNVADGNLAAELKGHEGAIFAIAFYPDGATVSTGGFDGKLRTYKTESGELVNEFVPVPILTTEMLMEMME